MPEKNIAFKNKLLPRFKEDFKKIYPRIDALVVKASHEKLDEEEISELRRHLHSLKSESAMMDLTSLAALFHRMEEILKNPLKDTRELNFLRDRIDEIGKTEILENGAIHNRPVRKFCAYHFSPDEIETILKGRFSGEQLYALTIQLDPGMPMPFAKAYLILNHLELKTCVLRTNPILGADHPVDNHRIVYYFLSAFSHDEILQMIMIEGLIQAELLVIDPLESKEQGFLRGQDHHYDHDSLGLGLEKLLIEYKVLHGRVDQAECADKAYNLALINSRFNNLVEKHVRKDLKLLEPLVQAFVKLLAGTQDINFSFSCPSIIVSSKIFDSLLELIKLSVNNSLSHSDFKTEDARIEIVFEQDLKSIKLWLKDNGNGISVDLYDQIRDLSGDFHANLKEKLTLLGFSSSSFSTLRSGRGVGLHTINHIVENIFKGDLHLDSAPGEGFSLSVTIPYERHTQKLVFFRVANEILAMDRTFIKEWEKISTRHFTNKDSWLKNQQGLEVYTIHGRIWYKNVPDDFIAIKCHTGGKDWILVVDGVLFEQAWWATSEIFESEDIPYGWSMKDQDNNIVFLYWVPGWGEK